MADTSLDEAVHHDLIIRSFNAYRYQHLAANNIRRQNYYTLPAEHQQLLPGHLKTLLRIDHCVVENAEFLEDVAQYARQNPIVAVADGAEHADGHMVADKGLIRPKPKVTDHELEKTRSTLRQLHRDWSAEGADERNRAYQPILEAVEAHFRHVTQSERGDVTVLVPGCGLGRLPFELAMRGFAAQGNEYSLFMLFTANFVLNNTESAEQFTLHPFCHTLSNIRTLDGSLRPIVIPDVLPTSLPPGSRFSMAAGDFLEVYKDDEGKWDCVVTCFFIDTAHNVIDYLKLIYKLLSAKGMWVNLGPSLWHWEGTTKGSLDIPIETVKAIARQIGFEISNERVIECSYTSNPQATMRYTYSTDFWTATKRKP